MEIPVSAQALTFAQGALLGLGLCLAYDLLRALRQLCPRTGLAADALFGLLLTASFLSFALTAGQGQFRLYVFLAVFLTAVLYFLTLSPLMLRVFRGLFRLLGRILRTLFAPVRFFLKFLKKISKTLFASFRKWGTMTCKHILGADAGMKFVKSSLLVKLVILILVVYATVTLVRLRSQISEKEAEAAGLTSSIASTQQENDRLQSSIDALDTPEGLEQVARDQLGMVSEGEIVFEDVGD